MRLSRLALALGLLVVPSAGFAGDAGNGAVLAADNCASCHDVAAGGAFKTYPPSFASIASFRPNDQIMARILFPPMHTPMPSGAFSLTPQNVDDLVAYIISLEGTAR